MRELTPADLNIVERFNLRARREGWQQHCDTQLNFRHPDLSQVFAVWRTQAGNRLMPARRDMTAARLKPFLSRIAVIERVKDDPVRWRWRLLGTRVTQIIGERTGKYLDEDAPPRQVARWVASAEMVLGIARPLRFVGRVLVLNKEYLFSELLFMPLSDDSGEPRFMMGFGFYSAERPADFEAEDILVES